MIFYKWPSSLDKYSHDAVLLHFISVVSPDENHKLFISEPLHVFHLLKATKQFHNLFASSTIFLKHKKNIFKPLKVEAYESICLTSFWGLIVWMKNIGIECIGTS